MSKFNRLHFIFIVGIVIAASFAYSVNDGSELKKFSSYEELKSYIENNLNEYQYSGYGLYRTTAIAETAQAQKDYSTTNIQVEGVDEADIVKTDGKYIYVVLDNRIAILDAFPAEDAKIISEINLNGHPSEIFVNGDRLVVMGQINNYDIMPLSSASEKMMILPYYEPEAFFYVYDITSRENPQLAENITMKGSYIESRMIGDHVYIIANQMLYTQNVSLPVIKENGEEVTIQASDISYFIFPDSAYIYTMMISIDLEDGGISKETILMGYSQKIFVSAENLYITYPKPFDYYKYYEGIIDALVDSTPSEIKKDIQDIKSSEKPDYEKLSSMQNVLEGYAKTLTYEEREEFEKSAEGRVQSAYEEIYRELEKTVVHKISISNGKIGYKSSVEVPGHVLNQFSMDEHDGYFRIATTISGFNSEGSTNNLYVFDGNLDMVGKLEDLAQGERIYSVRFAGEKAYMVTFRQIDPLFVIDLSNPQSPKVLGYLKIPGVSDYLHIYDENHVIGVGRDATEEGIITGLKLSLFDVGDVSSPKEISKFIIGNRGTYSEALNDHKAFLFSREKNLLVIPVSLVENDDYRWQGAYVFNLDVESGFDLKGRVSHSQDGSSDYYTNQVKRSLYIEGMLYTISNDMVKINSLNNLIEIKAIKIN